MISSSCKTFMAWHGVAGMLTVVAAVLALVVARLGPDSWYATLGETTLAVSLGQAVLTMPLTVWISQVLMTILLFVIGLECKRALLDRELVGADRLRLPFMAALGGTGAGVAAGALQGDPLLGLALGMDMTLGLAGLALLGERVPGALRVLFTSTAMFSILGGVFVQAGVSFAHWPGVVLPGLCLVVLAIMNRVGVRSVFLYLLPALAAWFTLADTPVLAVLVGPCAAWCIPAQARDGARSPLHDLERDLLPLVCLVGYPVLVFVNAGLVPGDGSWDPSSGSWFAGVLFGLFPGRALGVFGASWLGIRLGLCALPAGVGWKELAGVSVLTGSSLAGGLFFALLDAGANPSGPVRLGVLAGSFLSVVVGLVLLHQVLARRRNKVLHHS